MADSVELIEALDRRVKRREERREFFRHALSVGALTAGGAAMMGFSTQATAQTAAPSDTDILNFALNLEYLEAQFYTYAVTGAGLPAAQLTGTGTQGAVTGGRQANLTDRTVIQYAREIAADEAAHVASLRSALGTVAVAQPAINISGAAGGPFTAAATAAGIDLSASGGVFDPYASDDNFLLGAYIFEDVGVTAYQGASPLISNVDILDAAAGILAAEAFHAGIIRGALYARGVATPALRTNADKISDARDTLDGNRNSASGALPTIVADDDQGISPVTINGQTASNFVPTDTNGRTFSRTPEQVHNIVYLTRNQVTAGGFFPNGTNNPNPALTRSGAN
ncbi:Ferritin-like domain-containing protein [Sphingomonas palmae]|uniref:Ferritin-like domain-containing protein n=1 Tax=Sphingomonas palmae TaxID=1855283 RepID=A0A1H7RMU6_9SPHN|nr:ferritin-like domain-containing protein [Sphingomonas palmae]SEL61472.1 Ferritin-like domain-containing protein [Sphingomonas palmae]